MGNFHGLDPTLLLHPTVFSRFSKVGEHFTSELSELNMSPKNATEVNYQVENNTKYLAPMSKSVSQFVAILALFQLMLGLNRKQQ